MLDRLSTWLDSRWTTGRGDDERARRRLFLRVFVAGSLAIIAIITLVNSVEFWLSRSWPAAVYVALDAGLLLSLGALWVWLRGHYSPLAGYAFVGMLILVTTVTTPIGLLDGLLIAYAVPTLAASFIVAPPASFAAALLSVAGYSLSFAAAPGGLSYNYISVMVLGLLAFVAWLLADRLERSLRQVQMSQLQYQALVEQLPAFVYLTEFGREGQWLYAGPQIAQLLGFTPAEWLADQEIWYRQLHPDDSARVAQAVTASRVTGAPLHVEYRLFHRNGHVVWVRDDAVVIRSPGQPPRLQGLILDITAGRRAEEALRQNEARLRALLSALPDLIFRLNARAEFVDYWAARDSLHWPSGDFLGQPVSAVLPPALAAQVRASIQQALATRELQTFEYRLPVAGSLYDYEARLAASSEDEVLAVVRNITDRKAAEEAVRASLREKEVLLREIHHRVKNNLQVMISLLSLQSDQVRDPQALAALQESQDRLRTMALVHEELYQAHDLAQVDFGAYLDKLTASLLHVYAAPRTVRLRLDVGAVLLSVDTAIPCGLIVNELVANALKYAFPDGHGGDIWVTLVPAGETWCLTVGDNGAGLPPAVDIYNTQTLGLQLVNILARQLRGTLLRQDGPGTVFVIRFEGTGARGTEARR